MTNSPFDLPEDEFPFGEGHPLAGLPPFVVVRVPEEGNPDEIVALTRDDPIGSTWDFYSAHDVCMFLWGRNVDCYVIYKHGRQLERLRTGDLAEIERYLKEV